ncbi:ATP-dependent RNA helicase DeaD [Stieleria bergensis]|uniref:DEAD-box ATP-dependent RNA helicase RhpA n=1 Tax=Stieleria bergensis TaxID=2528025 RepID=A0A517SNA0_9BACT|nr:ATP-dependent RNA helicase DeaD [Planctomycetes bacterium SV_7m_r]
MSSSQQPAADVQPESFAALGLDSTVLQALEQCGYTTPTEVQARVIPSMLEGRDVLAQSQTGSGKTAAFALPILSTRQRKSNSVSTLVLAPTRELALQVSQAFETYSQFVKGFSTLAIYGGQDYEGQFRALRRGVDVVVGTPGRVIDHLKRGTLDLSQLQRLVLDEADEMLNMGFQEDVEFVLQHVPKQRQVTLFSATMPQQIRKIAGQYLEDPVTITVERKEATASSIRQRAVVVTPKDKMLALLRFLEAEPTDGVIIFTKTKDATIQVAEKLVRRSFNATALNGDMPQSVRQRTIDQLKSGRVDIVVATDVAARGLDVSRVSHVFNFDFPHDNESYVHRIGRTGRAGRSGDAIILVSPAQRRKLRYLEQTTKREIEIVNPPSADEINAMRVQRLSDRIAKTIEKGVLTVYEQLIQQHIESSGHDPSVVAAALLKMSQKGHDFFVKDAPKSKKSRDRDRGNDREGGFDSDQPRESRKKRKVGRPEFGMTRYRIEVGREDNAAPRNIVGAIANEAGIDSEFIGPIQIFPRFSTVDLPEDLPKDVLNTLYKARVGGKKMQIRVDSPPGKSNGKFAGKKDFKGADSKGKGKSKGKYKSKHKGKSADDVPKGYHSGGKSKKKGKAVQ